MTDVVRGCLRNLPGAGTERLIVTLIGVRRLPPEGLRRFWRHSRHGCNDFGGLSSALSCRFWERARTPRAPCIKGFAPLTVGLVLASGYVMSRAADHDWRAYLLTGSALVFVFTKVNPLIVVALQAFLAGWVLSKRPQIVKRPIGIRRRRSPGSFGRQIRVGRADHSTSSNGAPEPAHLRSGICRLNLL
jgi:hypothetical protein